MSTFRKFPKLNTVRMTFYHCGPNRNYGKWPHMFYFRIQNRSFTLFASDQRHSDKLTNPKVQSAQGHQRIESNGLYSNAIVIIK